jgi:hypothetical protein
MTDPIPHDNPSDLLERSLAAMRNAPIPDGPSQQLIADTLAALNKAQGDRPQPNTRRKTNMRIITRLAASLIVAIGAAALIFFTTRTGSVAFADVVQKVREAKTLTFDCAADLPGMGPVKMHFFMNSAGQTRVEAAGSVSVIDPKAGKILTLAQAMKQAVVMDIGAHAYPQNKTPSNFVEEFKNLDTKKAKDLGEKEIDGKLCKGFVADDKGIQFTVWAQKSDGKLQRIEMEVPMPGGTSKMVMSNFAFDQPLDPALFSIEPPAGYDVQTFDGSKVFQAVINAPGETHVVAVLRAYAEANDGQFPPKLNLDWGVYARIIGNKAAKVAGPNPKLDDKQMELSAHIGAANPFLMSLPKDGWDYLGDGVKLGEKNKVVFWYKDPKTNQHRAVYGDLSVKDVAAEDLPGH